MASETRAKASPRDFEAAYRSLITRGSALRLHSRKDVVGVMRHYLRRLDLLRPLPGNGGEPEASPAVAPRAARTLDDLRVVHVAGSKGKGSTCIQTESLLRARGLKTGLFTSPHLIDLRERFRINGKPVNNDTFRQHFWFVWDRLHESDQDDATPPPPTPPSGEIRKVPGFFRFMTLLAFKIFVEEGVDAAIIEVGIGGRLDATNVIEKPVVCGISLLDFDHVQILGGSLPKIAAEKAGIMKPGAPCFTIPQRQSAMETLVKKAAALEGCSLELVVPLESSSKLGSRKASAGKRSARSGTFALLSSPHKTRDRPR